jgi:hypothetical protein
MNAVWHTTEEIKAANLEMQERIRRNYGRRKPRHNQ